MYRRIAPLIAALVGVAATGVFPSVAQAGESGCRVDYRINYQMSNTFGSDLLITNLGAPLDGWTLEFTFPHKGQRVLAVPDGTWSQSENRVTIRSVEYNAALDSGNSTSISILGTYEKLNPIPSRATLNGVTCIGLPAATQPPHVVITAPTETTLAEPATFTVTASAGDVDGNVTRVEFYNYRTLLGVDTEAPYELTVEASPARIYHLLAVAYDDSGQFTHSAWKHLTVLPPPITVTGTIMDGVELGCKLLAGSDNNLYELVPGTITLPPVGTRVKVHGQVRNDVGSFCMQGDILQVLSLEIVDRQFNEPHSERGTPGV